MTIRDIRSNISIAQTLVPAARVNGTFNGTAIDLRGFDSAALEINFGAYTDGTHTPSLQHSDDGSSFTNVTTTEMQGTISALSNSGGQNAVQVVGYVGTKRYLRGVMTVASATTGALSALNIIRGTANQQPAS